MARPDGERLCPTVSAFTANNSSPWPRPAKRRDPCHRQRIIRQQSGIGRAAGGHAVFDHHNRSSRKTEPTPWPAERRPWRDLNWWGSPAETNITALLEGNVTYSPFLTYEPLLTPAVGAAGGVTQVGSASASLQLACRTADSMRLSEDFTFTGVFFVPFTNYDSFPFSPGGGLKHIYAQFRSLTGATNAPIELTSLISPPGRSSSPSAWRRTKP